MKILNGRLHTVFGDLAQGETFLSDGNPFIKVAQSAGSKLPNPPHNGVRLDSGTLFVFPKDTPILKAELGITGLEGKED